MQRSWDRMDSAREVPEFTVNLAQSTEDTIDIAMVFSEITGAKMFLMSFLYINDIDLDIFNTQIN